MSYVGFYINLDASLDRREEIEAEIARFRLQDRYRRFPAVRGNAPEFPNPHLSPAEIGCFASHCFLLKENAATGSHLHVIEDDTVFSRFTEQGLRWAIETGVIDRYDILFTDTFVTPMNGEYQYCKGLYDRCVRRDTEGRITGTRLDIVKHIAGTNSYIVNANSIGKVAELLQRNLNAGAKKPLDLAFRIWAENSVLRTGALFPFVTGVRLDRTLDTSVDGRPRDDLTSIAAWLGRHSFFVDCDRQALYAEARRLLPVPLNDPHHDLLAHILSFSLTDKYRPY